MALLRGLALTLILGLSSCYLHSSVSSATSDGFLQCLSANIPSGLIYTQQGASSNGFTEVLVSSVRNPRLFTNTTVKPLCIVTPTGVSHVQAAVRCGVANGVRLRVRSGGHDYEGLSYRSVRPEVFGVVDLSNLRAIAVDDSGGGTAWVDSGATLGELYYAVAKTNPEAAFPAGICPTIGVGGHLSGGGMGMLMRRFGLSADNVLDARLVTAGGDLVDRAGMGEDHFWAIRGGGGESFGIVVSWKVRLVRVPPTVTAFTVFKTADQGAADVLAKWEDVAPGLPGDITIRVIVQGTRAAFQSLYLGTCGDLVPMLGGAFPELGVTTADCLEITWLQSAAYFNSWWDWNRDAPLEPALLERNTSLSTFTKNKSDYVRRAISKEGWEKIFTWLAVSGAGMMILEPHGGFVGGVPAAATPYPHRTGVLYNVQYIAFWSAGDDQGAAAATAWIGDFYDFMEQYVSKDPRETYVNYRDLDLGQNLVVDGVTTFDSGRVWGERYFAGNFQRLAAVKAAVDPTDYFRNEQSIPPQSMGSKRRSGNSLH